MDSEIKPYKSLPPLVKGKTHAYLKLSIDEIIWLKNPGDITLIAVWWGETESAKFRQININKDTVKSNQNVIEIYAVKTNINLFREYVKNCKSIEFIIISEETHNVIGSAKIKDLLHIFEYNSCNKYSPIINNIGYKIGELYIDLKLYTMIQSNKKQNATSNDQEFNLKLFNTPKCNKYFSSATKKSRDSDEYKSILREKRNQCEMKFKAEITDTVIAQVVSKAQQLRSAILQQQYNEDQLAHSNNSTVDNILLNNHIYEEPELNDCVYRRNMKFPSKHKVLSLVDTNITSNIKPPMYENKETEHLSELQKYNSLSSNVNSKTQSEIKPAVLNTMDSLKIKIDSFSLSSAGYRRVKSSVSNSTNITKLSAIYFLQYDFIFKESQHFLKNGKSIIKKKINRIHSNKITDQIIYFKHEELYDILNFDINLITHIQFKIFYRHSPKKMAFELGSGSISIQDIIKSINLSILKKVSMNNKKVKIGELTVLIELESNRIHLNTKPISSPSSLKENMPETHLKSSLNTHSYKYKCQTGTQSKSTNTSSSTSTEKLEQINSDNDTKFISERNAREDDENNSDLAIGKRMNSNSDKVLLHGLVYVTEGKGLLHSNTYLMCKAFWREDKAISQLCKDTYNPIYNFCQLIPLLCDTELIDCLEKNHIIIEVYSKDGNETDNFLGIAKLSMYQLYIAYRDPSVVSQLLHSKYPVVGVDDWVPIRDPLSGESCGELLALVALGTVEQIARLEMSRRLCQTPMIYQSVYYRNNSIDHIQHFDKIEQSTSCNSQNSVDEPQYVERFIDQKDINTFIRSDGETSTRNSRTQGCQTELTVFSDNCEKNLKSESTDSHKHKSIEIVSERQGNRHELNVNSLISNNSLENSHTSSSKDSFCPSTEMFRSVGVGAEIDDRPIQCSSNNKNNNAVNLTDETVTSENKNESEKQDTFKVILEVECALHLPKIEKFNETLEPFTYVTFQKCKSKYSRNLSSYIHSNVYEQSCNPKWNWKCDTKLPIELLFNHETRLIIKVWRLEDPEKSLLINLNKDVVIGFSAIDLTVLLAGFPTISGWFHIMDFTGKCNGQLKVNVTPLDNLLSLQLPSNSAKLIAHYAPLFNQPSHQPQQNMPSNGEIAEVNFGLDDTPMSFLSASLKQKLIELDEITKRLQSRLHDVTSNAFDDEFENDCYINEQSNEIINLDDKTVCNSLPKPKFIDRRITYDDEYINQSNAQETDAEIVTTTMVDKANSTSMMSLNGKSNNPSYNRSDSGYCTNTNNYSYPIPIKHQLATCNEQVSDHDANYPKRGTKMHISHLLDKLTLQLPSNAGSKQISNAWKQNKIIDLLSNADLINQKTNNSNFQSQIDVSTGGTDNQWKENVASTSYGKVDTMKIGKQSQTIVKSQVSNKMSMIVKEELISEDNSESSKCDELSTYLMTSNIQHMDLNNMINPLLYRHLIPDIQAYDNISPEGEAEKILDSRYVTAFNTTVNNDLSKYQNVVERDSINDCENINVNQHILFKDSEDINLFKETTSEMSKISSTNFDMAVVQKSNSGDNMTSNNTDTTTVDSYHSLTSSPQSISATSRQAPEGGNPVEDSGKLLFTKQRKNSQVSI